MLTEVGRKLIMDNTLQLTTDLTDVYILRRVVMTLGQVPVLTGNRSVLT
jgi:hypothetical protein